MTRHQTSDHSDENDDFFVKKCDNSTALMQLDEYLLNPSTEMMTVTAFFKTNTPLPASTTCERLFSAAGHIFTPMRARIGNTNF